MNTYLRRELGGDLVPRVFERELVLTQCSSALNLSNSACFAARANLSSVRFVGESNFKEDPYFVLLRWAFTVVHAKRNLGFFICNKQRWSISVLYPYSSTTTKNTARIISAEGGRGAVNDIIPLDAASNTITTTTTITTTMSSTPHSGHRMKILPQIRDLLTFPLRKLPILNNYGDLILVLRARATDRDITFRGAFSELGLSRIVRSSFPAARPSSEFAHEQLFPGLPYLSSSIKA
ncbi:predicted protein [Histoplasma capsulatum G186AR]|uniref:Uncharacterized protein n=1 Tax=Ajellomyces capsulatus (strain G186AR / H82 / ATCC MYA-2454 / RMSCC 2432) TaxID=447093 RepID=C0NJ02_AJECG|nr:uncharacterized protein HCBG_03132 [Histoplasma capsulatum G186AR]EEH07843.1 predicted protein [Histoplasma capsulatum G186AR]